MATKFKLKYIDNPDNEFVWQGLDIPEERAMDLDYRMECIIHEMTRPFRKGRGDESPGSDQLIKMFLSLAENAQELAYVSYCAGIAVPKIWNTEDEFEEDFDDDWRE